MKEIYPNITKFQSVIDERIELASSERSRTVYVIVKERFKELFNSFTKDDIIISKKEYKELLLLRINDTRRKRRDILEVGIVNTGKEANKLNKELDNLTNIMNETREKIEYLDLI